jgi:hypothetical protein
VIIVTATFKEDLNIRILRNDIHLVIRTDQIKVFKLEYFIIEGVSVKNLSLNVILIFRKGFERVIGW